MHLKMSFFCANKAQFGKAGNLPKLGLGTSQKPFLETFYRAAYRTAERTKPHTTAEISVKPCALEMVELVCGLGQKEKNWKRFLLK
jgi:hypothetical protein